MLYLDFRLTFMLLTVFWGAWRRDGVPVANTPEWWNAQWAGCGASCSFIIDCGLAGPATVNTCVIPKPNHSEPFRIQKPVAGGFVNERVPLWSLYLGFLFSSRSETDRPKAYSLTKSLLIKSRPWVRKSTRSTTRKRRTFKHRKSSE